MNLIEKYGIEKLREVISADLDGATHVLMDGGWIYKREGKLLLRCCLDPKDVWEESAYGSIEELVESMDDGYVATIEEIRAAISAHDAKPTDLSERELFETWFVKYRARFDHYSGTHNPKFIAEDGFNAGAAHQKQKDQAEIESLKSAATNTIEAQKAEIEQLKQSYNNVVGELTELQTDYQQLKQQQSEPVLEKAIRDEFERDEAPHRLERDANGEYITEGMQDAWELHYTKAVLAGKQQQVQQWVKCSDRLPTIDDTNDQDCVFACSSNSHVFYADLKEVALYNHDNERWRTDITHWFPLSKTVWPQPPLPESGVSE